MMVVATTQGLVRLPPRAVVGKEHFISDDTLIGSYTTLFKFLKLPRPGIDLFH